MTQSTSHVTGDEWGKCKTKAQRKNMRLSVVFRIVCNRTFQAFKGVFQAATNNYRLSILAIRGIASFSLQLHSPL